VAVLAWSLIQALAPAPEGLAAPIWRIASDTLGHELAGRVSVAPWRTLAGAALLAGYGLVFWTALRLGRDARLCMLALRTLFWAAVAYAAWALADHFAGWNYVFLMPKDPYAVANLGGYASGTFVNRDHFAGFCGLAFFCGLALLMRRSGSILRSAISEEGQGVALLKFSAETLGLLCLALAVWLSRSRAAIGLLLICALAFAALAAWRIWHGGYKRLAVSILVASAIAALAAVVFIAETGAAAERLASMAKAWTDRANIYRQVVVAIAQNPWMGTGLGAFVDAFPLYRGSEAGYGGVWNAAHNIYLESLFGLGIPAFLLLAIAIGWPVTRVMIGAVKRERNATAPIAAASASLFLLLHGLVDFSVQTPAVAYYWAALLGFGSAQSWSSREVRGWE
jgi:O-antigen ligase